MSTLMHRFLALRTHRLRWPALLAGAAGIFGYFAFVADSITPRLLLGTAALVAGAAYPVAWSRAPGPTVVGGIPRRLGRFVVLVVLSVFALGGAVVGVAVWLGRLLASSIEPVDVIWMYLGLLILVITVGALVVWWSSSFSRIMRDRPQRWWVTGCVTLLVVGAGLGYLSHRKVAGEQDREGKEQSRQAGRGLYDLLLVVDPADPVSRQLIRAARRDVARDRAGRPFPGPSAGVLYDFAYGIAVPQRRHGGDPLWRLVEPPTNDERELADSLARIEIRRGAAPAAGSYGRLLTDTLIQERVRWRAGAQHGVAFILQRLPSLAELDRYVRSDRDAIPEWAEPATACRNYLDRHPARLLSEDQSSPVSWGDALSVQCNRRQEYREWEDKGRPVGAEVRPLPPVAIHALTGEDRRSRDVRWWTWVRALDGRFHRPAVSVDENGRHLDAPQLLLDGRDIQTGVPVGQLAELARVFRPHLFFDSDEKFFPVDVDWLLAEKGNEVCDRQGGPDNCEPIEDSRSLVGALDEYIDFEGGARLGRDLVGRDADPARMYVHVREHDRKLYLDYWWFFHFNSSPWQPEVNCLPGLTFGGLSCHDHEGDWEGVTVVLGLVHDQVVPDPYRIDNLIPEAVVYEAHGHERRWPWSKVELAADRHNYATHPVVYVAAGSHASYPAGCRSDQCNQRLSGHGLPDGGFDGAREWPYDKSEKCSADQVTTSGARLGPCLVALPSTRDGEHGVLWNAFPGAWGKATCTVIAKVCSQIDGPRSPSTGNRFTEPWSIGNGPMGELKRVRQRYGAPVAGTPTRWPPDPWPPSGDKPTPAEPTLPNR
jgi:hypothetical protein